MTQFRDPLKKSGVVVGIYSSSDPLCELELWRSTQVASTASSFWSVTRYPPSTRASYTEPVLLPASTRYHYFKARSQKLGHSASTFTPVVRGKPVIFSQYPASPPPLTNNSGEVEFVTPTFFYATNPPSVGAPSQVTPTTYVEKTITVHPSQFVAQNNTYSYSITGVDLRPGSTTLVGFTANLALPPGVLLTSLSARLYKASTADVYAISVFQRLSTDDTSATALVLVSSTATTLTGWHTRSQSLSHAVTTAGYGSNLSLNANSSGVNGARFGWLRLKYRMPTYAKSI